MGENKTFSYKSARKEKSKQESGNKFAANIPNMTGKEITLKDYHERINKVLVYINNHLDEKMELEKLAGISNFSAFHFHRIMRAYLNEPIGAFILRLRLDKAAFYLEVTDLSPTEIAYKCGYEMPSSFNKAFKKRFGVSPGDFRKGHINMSEMSHFIINKNFKQMELKAKIKELKPRQVIYARSMGDYNKSASEAWDKICTYAAKHKLFGYKTEMLGVSYDDPDITETEKLRYEACITINKDIAPEGEIGIKTIEGGKYAVFLHKGPYDTLNETYNAIHRQWLPGSGYKLRDIPLFEKYLNDPDKTKPEKLQTEIYIPVE